MIKDLSDEPFEQKIIGAEHQSTSTFYRISPEHNSTLAEYNLMSLSVSLLNVICFQNCCSVDVARLLSSQRLPPLHFFFCPPLWLEYAALPVRCPTLVSSQCAESAKAPERILLRLASPGLASPSLKLTTPAPSARQRRGPWGWYTCMFVCALCVHVCVNMQIRAGPYPLRFNQCFSVCNTCHMLYMHLCGWVSSDRGSMKCTLVMCHILQKTNHIIT